MTSNKFTNTLLFLTRTFNELHHNSRTIIEQSFKLTKSNLFIYVAPKLAPIANTVKNRLEIRLLLNHFYANSLKIDPRVNVVCLLPPERLVKYGVGYDLVLTDLGFSAEGEASIRDHLRARFETQSGFEVRPMDDCLQPAVEPFEVN